MGCLVELNLLKLHTQTVQHCMLSKHSMMRSCALASTRCRCKQDEEEDGPTTSGAQGEVAQAAAQAPAAAKEAGKEGGKGKKRSGEDIIEREKERSKKAKEDATRKAEWFELKQNTSVYVSGLPSDVTEEEVAQVCQASMFVTLMLPPAVCITA